MWKASAGLQPNFILCMGSSEGHLEMRVLLCSEKSQANLQLLLLAGLHRQTIWQLS